jgi:hypothetical protein
MTKTTIESMIQFQQHDWNGVLTIFEGNASHAVPFPIARVFTITGVSAGGTRGNHLHRHCSQLLVCLHGSIDVSLNDGVDAVSHITRQGRVQEKR